MRGLSFEQMVLIADEVCAHTDSRIRSYPSLAACAATTSARLHGVPLHHRLTQMIKTLQDHIRALRPLTHHNDVFSHVVADILQDLNAVSPPTPPSPAHYPSRSA
ncbi:MULTISPECIES: hypothetical protein [unclassified Corynebacterium]|uniref:hypothetical protein n=1 Tax=unclassified Corynebacterium TaxID=2624378 RepID=UPI0029CA939D|nr:MULTISPECIES: hypothetical protein [unclassified Corynebacterium]WPF66169.1 hypothetical protein OLX12_00050 [Corynebacterium sp. 22KM0430]WPF68661.1 hypothetical protein OLW90_00050 [Corynebacterium sp. 21KM1197]